MEKVYLGEELIGKKVVLKKLKLDDSEVMFQAVDKDRKRLDIFMPWAKHVTSVQDEIDYIKLQENNWNEFKIFDYNIFERETNKYLGGIGVHNISFEHNRCEIGYWIIGDEEGKGYISSAVKTLEKELFKIGFNRVVIRCDIKNDRSANVPKRCGYTFEGILRECIIDHHGNVTSDAIYSKLKSEYSDAVVKSIHEESYKNNGCFWGEGPAKLMHAILKHKNSGTLLDLGAGEGRNDVFMAQNGFDVTAVDYLDIAVEKIQYWAEKENVSTKIKAYKQDLRSLEFSSLDRSTFDVITSIATLHFIEKKHLNDLFKKIKNATNAGGLNAISVFNTDNEGQHAYLFQKGELLEIYSDWEVIAHKEMLTPMHQHGENGKPHQHGASIILAKKPN